MMEGVKFFKPIDDAFESFIFNVGNSYFEFRKIFIFLITAITTIQLGIHFVRFGLRGKPDESPVDFLLKLVFWYAVIFYTPEIMSTVQSTFVRLGARGSASSPISLPSAIIRAGWQASTPIMEVALSIVEDVERGRWGALKKTTEWISVVLANFPKLLLSFFVSLAIMLCYILIMAQFFMAYIEFAILGAAAAILFPLGLLKFTSFVNEKLVGAIIAHGVKLMLLQFAIGIGIRLFAAGAITSASLLRDLEYGEIISALINAVLFAIIVMNIPALATGIMSGQPTLSGQSIQQAAVAGAVVGRGARNTGRAVGAIAAGAASGGVGAVGAATKAIGAGRAAGGFYRGAGAGTQGRAALSAMGGSLASSAGTGIRDAGRKMWRRVGTPSTQAGRAGLRQIAQNRRTQSTGLVDYIRRSKAEGARAGESSAIKRGHRMESQLNRKELRRNPTGPKKQGGSA